MSTTYTVGVKIDGSAAGLAKASKEALAHTKMMGAGMGDEFSKMAKARRLLGVRAEAQIQQEILKTRAAYVDLTRVGTMSWNDQRRAAQAMREEVTRLTNEMGRMTTRQQVMRGFKGVAAVAGVTAGAAMVLKPKIEATMDADLAVRHLANLAYGLDARGKQTSQATRKAGLKDLKEMITAATEYGGGTRDQARETLSTYLGVGQFTAKELKDGLFKETMLTAKATNTSPQMLANLANKTIPGMGFKPSDASWMFGAATYAGKRGGFELKDMGMHLPEQMPFAHALGMSGKKDFSKLLGLNQAAFLTAGSPDQAGVNVKNLLEQLSLKHTADRFKKIGINLPGELAKGRLNGLDALDVVGNLLDGQLNKNKNYKNLQRQVTDAKDGTERKAALESIMPIIQGTEIGKLIHEQRALLALFGMLNNKALMTDVSNNAINMGDTHKRDFELIKDSPAFKVEQAENAAKYAMQQSMDKLTPAIGSLADATAALFKQYPGYMQAIIAATGALGFLATAAGALAFAGFKLPGAGVPKVPGSPGSPGSPGAIGAGSSSSKLVGGLRALGWVGAGISLGSALFGTSDEDLATLAAADARKAGGGGSGTRGQGFNDPRLIGGGAASAAALEQSLRASEVKGEITVLVTAAPGISVQTSLNSTNPRIPMKSALGQTNMQAGN